MKGRKVEGKKLVVRMTTAVLATVFAIFVMPVREAAAVNAEGDTLASKMCLGVSGIKEPEPGRYGQKWTGSYIRFGKYDGEPVKYRVLENDRQSILLECDSILYCAPFSKTLDNQEGKYENGIKGNHWFRSTLREGLNGEDFLKKEGVFSEEERDIIVNTSSDSHDLSVGNGEGQVTQSAVRTFVYSPRLFDRIFLLDVEDLMNTKYGYHTAVDGVERYEKTLKGQSMPWWIRNSVPYEPYDEAGFASGSDVDHTKITDENIGVSPAMYLSTKKVLFATAVSGNVGEDNAEYRLTLKDLDRVFRQYENLPAIVSESGVVELFYYCFGSQERGEFYVMITDKPYTEDNSNQAQILYYGQIKDYKCMIRMSPNVGMFVLPDGFDVHKWGSDYHVYLVAEEYEYEKSTDFASIPQEVTNIKIVPGVSNVFNDVPANAWYAPAIQFIYNRDIMKGKGDFFDPNAIISREDFVQMLFNHMRINDDYGDYSPNDSTFSDVKYGKYYYDAVLWAHFNGIVEGYGNGKFGVGDPITREQIAVMLYKYIFRSNQISQSMSECEDPERYLQYQDGDKVSSWARTAVNWAVEKGIITGKGVSGSAPSELRIDPTGNATRAECAQMFMKFLLIDSGAHAGRPYETYD